MEEHNYTCPHCFTSVSVLIDPSILKQQYIEDCERCCNPTEFKISLSPRQKVISFSAVRVDA